MSKEAQIKSNKKKKRRLSSSRKKDEGKVLTFVDMSHLSYLSKSVAGPSLLQVGRKEKQVILPENTKVAILEDESEDYMSEVSLEKHDQTSAQVKDLTVQDVASEIFDQILNVIFEAHDPTQIYKYEIVDNQVLKANIQKLHKQVFVKENLITKGAEQRKVEGIDAFKNAAKSRVVKRSLPIQNSSEAIQIKTTSSTQMVATSVENSNSLLSNILEAQDPDAFVIMPPEKTSKTYLETKIYFWETSQSIKIKISTTDVTSDVIRHIMTLYKQSPFQKKTPLKFTDPNRYSLWLIDEYDSKNKYRPDDEMGPRPMRDPIGQFDSMAFIETKNFKPKNENSNAIDETITAQLEAEGKRMVQVNINNAYQVMNISFVMNKDW